MARVHDQSTSASLGQPTMIRTIQCPSCGVVLNVPESASGRRLKCPHCQMKFLAPALSPADSAIDEPGPASSLLPSRGPGSSGSVELPSSRLGSSGSVELPSSRTRGSSGSVELPSSPAPLRETFDLPMLDEHKPRSAPSTKAPAPPKAAPVADAMALFQDEPKSARKPTGAEARAKARRCTSCGGVVGVGMSLCNTCGLDLDTGQRITPLEVFEDEMPVSYRPPMPSIGILFVGTLCAAGNLLLSVASLVAWNKGEQGAPFLLVIWLFGIYASVQFFRRKSMRPLFLSLSLAVGIGFIYLVVMPIWQANVTTGAELTTEDTLNPADDRDMPRIKSITEDLDMTKISWGIFSLLAYAGLAVYLNSPSMKREFKK